MICSIYMIDIVFTSDNNYLRYQGVTICSICENDRDADIRFHVVLSGEVTDEGKNYLQEICCRYGKSLFFYPIHHELLGVLPAGESGQPVHISGAAYYRLFLASILPDTIDRVLYLDCDLIAMHSLAPLWNWNIDGCPVAAVPDMDEAVLDKYRRLRYPTAHGYFNSGVLLINLKYWREHNCQGMFEHYVSEHLDRIVYHDQDVLNAIFHDSKCVLPIRFNVQEAALYTRVNISWEYDEQLAEALKDPLIVHYTTWQKPWIEGCSHPWKDLWYKYLRIVGTGDFKPVKMPRRKVSLMGRARNIMVKFGLLEPMYQFRRDLK